MAKTKMKLNASNPKARQLEQQEGNSKRDDYAAGTTNDSIVAGKPKPGISACIMVKNEEKNLPGMLDSLKGVVDEIVAIDHESSDHTAEILRKAGAKIIPLKDPERNFKSEGKGSKSWVDIERTLLNDNASYEWILHIDADERLTGGARQELPKLAKQDDYDVIWLISKHFYAPGKWFRYGFYRPHPEPRFYRKRCKINWNVIIHEPPRIEGRHFYSNVEYDHLYYTPGEERIRRKHEVYIQIERRQKAQYLSKNFFVMTFFILLGYPVYFLYGLARYLAFLDGWEGVKSAGYLSMYFARSGYLEVFFKRKLGLIRYSPYLENERVN